jgi:hypothetical protein
MRFRDYSRAGDAGVIVAGRPVDHIRDAADSGLYWVLSARPDRSWQLHQFDDTAGRFTEPVAVSPPMADDDDAHVWALGVLDLGTLSAWIGWQDGPVRRYIEETYTLVRDVRGRRPGREIETIVHRDDDAITRVTVHERWPATGQTGVALAGFHDEAFHDVSDMLNHVSTLLGLDPDSWQEITAGTHYRHP